MGSPIRFSDVSCESKAMPPEEEAREENPDWTAAATADGLKGLLAHCQSKAANVLFTVALRERTLKGYGIDSFAVDPGWETSLSDVMRLS
jgi:NAD(P)-dependent dehydrogenase (short-subunit alcohol dehydrogenase family)